MSGERRWVTGAVALALSALVAVGPVRAADDVAAWMSALHSGGMEPAEAAIGALAKAGEPAVAPLADLVTTGTTLERRRACAALGGMGLSVVTAVAPLVVASADPELDVRLAAVDGLTRWSQARGEAREALLARLTDPVTSVRVRAAASLASSREIVAAQVEPTLLAALESPSVGPRIAALGGLARLAQRSSDAAVAAVVIALGDTLAPVRGAAAVAVASIRPRDAPTVAALCPRLDDPDPWVAMGSARALASLEAACAGCAADLLARRDAGLGASRRAAWLLHARVAREPAAAEALAAHADDRDEVVRGYARSAAWLARSHAAPVAASAREGDD